MTEKHDSGITAIIQKSQQREMQGKKLTLMDNRGTQDKLRLNYVIIVQKQKEPRNDRSRENFLKRKTEKCEVRDQEEIEEIYVREKGNESNLRWWSSGGCGSW